jgi:protein TonB
MPRSPYLRSLAISLAVHAGAVGSLGWIVVGAEARADAEEPIAVVLAWRLELEPDSDSTPREGGVEDGGPTEAQAVLTQPSSPGASEAPPILVLAEARIEPVPAADAELSEIPARELPAELPAEAPLPSPEPAAAHVEPGSSPGSSAIVDPATVTGTEASELARALQASGHGAAFGLLRGTPPGASDALAGDGGGTGPSPAVAKTAARDAAASIGVPARLVHGPLPEYPRASVLAREEGTVSCRLWVDASGRVTRVELIASSGHARLDRAALAVLKDWRFEPARVGGVAVATSFQKPIAFRLPDEP